MNLACFMILHMIFVLREDHITKKHSLFYNNLSIIN